MPTVIPYIPRTITVHLGAPDQWAENVTVPFPEYVKNVASSEIYPTWDPAAIRANVLAIISFALNRVYTEFYPSRGYDFQITSSTAYDQKFIRDRDIFENISRIVDEIFNDYIRRQGSVEPLSANVDSIELLQNKTGQPSLYLHSDKVVPVCFYFGKDVFVMIRQILFIFMSLRATIKFNPIISCTYSEENA